MIKVKLERVRGNKERERKRSVFFLVFCFEDGRNLKLLQKEEEDNKYESVLVILCALCLCVKFVLFVCVLFMFMKLYFF